MGHTAIATPSSSSTRRKAEQFDRLLAAMSRYGVQDFEAALRYIDDPLFFDSITGEEWARGLADRDLNLGRLERAVVAEVVIHGAATKRDAAQWLGLTPAALRAKIAALGDLATAPRMPGAWKRYRGGHNLKKLRDLVIAEALRRSGGSNARASKLLGAEVRG